jgi:hypothetical protein
MILISLKGTQGNSPAATAAWERVLFSRKEEQEKKSVDAQ